MASAYKIERETNPRNAATEPIHLHPMATFVLQTFPDAQAA